MSEKYIYINRGRLSEQQWLNVFGDNLLSLLYDAKMSQQELSEITDISKSTISKYINKQQMPSIMSVIKIAEALNISLDELLLF